jgi:hypothetical protein
VASVADLMICHPVSYGETWFLVKTESDFGHGERWRRLPVVSLLKTSFMQLSSPLTGCSGGNPRSVFFWDRMMAMLNAVLPTVGIVLEQTLVGGGSEVERRVSSRIDDGGSWWRGAVESQRRMRAEVRA